MHSLALVTRGEFRGVYESEMCIRLHVEYKVSKHIRVQHNCAASVVSASSVSHCFSVRLPSLLHLEHLRRTDVDSVKVSYQHSIRKEAALTCSTLCP